MVTSLYFTLSRPPHKCLQLSQTQGPEGHQQGQGQSHGQCPPSEPFPGPDSSIDQKPMYGQGYPGTPGPPSMHPSYGGNTMQGQSPGGFNPMMNQMGQTGGFPGMAGMGAMGNPRAQMRPRMMPTKPLRLQLQQRLQGQQVIIQTHIKYSRSSCSLGH